MISWNKCKCKLTSSFFRIIYNLEGCHQMTHGDGESEDVKIPTKLIANKHSRQFYWLCLGFVPLIQVNFQKKHLRKHFYWYDEYLVLEKVVILNQKQKCNILMALKNYTWEWWWFYIVHEVPMNKSTSFCNKSNSSCKKYLNQCKGMMLKIDTYFTMNLLHWCLLTSRPEIWINELLNILILKPGKNNYSNHQHLLKEMKNNSLLRSQKENFLHPLSIRNN